LLPTEASLAHARRPNRTAAGTRRTAPATLRPHPCAVSQSGSLSRNPAQPFPLSRAATSPNRWTSACARPDQRINDGAATAGYPNAISGPQPVAPSRLGPVVATRPPRRCALLSQLRYRDAGPGLYHRPAGHPPHSRPPETTLGRTGSGSAPTLIAGDLRVLATLDRWGSLATEKSHPQPAQTIGPRAAAHTPLLNRHSKTTPDWVPTAFRASERNGVLRLFSCYSRPFMHKLRYSAVLETTGPAQYLTCHQLSH